MHFSARPNERPTRSSQLELSALLEGGCEARVKCWMVTNENYCLKSSNVYLLALLKQLRVTLRSLLIQHK